MTKPRLGVDWQEVHARVERARCALEAAEAPSPEEVRRILSQRARAFAQPLAAPATTGERLELLVIALAEERYGIEIAHVADVFPLRELTPVPCTPPLVLGVINHRGRVLPILDLRRLFDLAGQGIAEGSRVVAVEAGGMRFGLYSDGLKGIVQVGVDEISPPPPALGGGRQAPLRGVTGDMLAVLDLDALVRDPQIAVNDGVG
jgi:purine-binding chemotaxis protein CheW